MCIQSKTLSLGFKMLQMGLFGFKEKETGTKGVAMATKW